MPTQVRLMAQTCECAAEVCTCSTRPFSDLGKPALAAAKEKHMNTQVNAGGNRVVGTAAPDPILMRAMLRVGIQASSIDGTGRLSMAQLDWIKATVDTTSAKMQLGRLAQLAGLLPVELESGPRSPTLSAL